MTPEQRKIVSETWNLVLPIADQAAVLFYDRLFEIDPTTRVLFRETNLADQRKKLMQVLSVAVQGLERLDELVPIVEELGRRHTGYGVQGHHYDSVGAALLWTLEQGLGLAWSDEAADAWGAAYRLLAGVMHNAAHTVPNPIAAE